jgi:hypothetical protein
MPLRDHFAPPLSQIRHWHAFHNAWATNIATDLNQKLPERYFAEANVQFGIEIDVAAFETEGKGEYHSTWTPPPPVQTLELPVVADIVEVTIYHQEGGPILAAAIELISPSNKDRPAHREAFVQKCATYLREGISLAVVDIVTERGGNLHRDLLAQFAGSPATAISDLYCSAYRPVKRNAHHEFDVWYESLTLGQKLPQLPLWIHEHSFPIDLEATYERTCEAYRIK